MSEIKLEKRTEGEREAYLEGYEAGKRVGYCSAARTSGWIPCKERLPKKDGKYFVTVKTKWTGTDSDFQSISAEFVDGLWMTYFFEVLAWMPLPEPYREMGEE